MLVVLYLQLQHFSLDIENEAMERAHELNESWGLNGADSTEIAVE
jgi:hypothetical protein